MSADSQNIVLVSIDSLRGDHCGFLGDDRGLTPAMDRLAKEGVAYNNAVAPGPQTFSSMPSVFTGRERPPTTLENYPQESHWERRLAAIDDYLAKNASLAERLQERGYETAAVTPNPWTSTASGFDRGFDRFVDCSGTSEDSWIRRIAEGIPGVDTNTRAGELVLNMLSGSEFFSQWETLYDDIEKARKELSEPYFLWVFVLDTHYPFIVSRAHRREQTLLGIYYNTYRSSEPMRGNGGELSDRVRGSMGKSYRDTVRASDAFVDRLQSDLAVDDPVFIVHSDHGESFGEHGNYGHHHREVYEENVHVPYLVHNAGIDADIDEPTSLTTVYDTALTIARTGTFDPADTTEPYVVASSECGRNKAVRGQQFKHLDLDGERLLFDLSSDPDERTNVAEMNPELSTELHQRLERRDRHTGETNKIHHGTRLLVAQRSV